ncbi:MAG TPA: hypothetical protein VE075_05535 [Thermoanaerobaculia bacterium]|nr:hypothetical protein [Thermoanaerobaculia bacterium]
MMMGRALLALGLLGTAGLIAAAALGYGVNPGAADAQVRGHVLLGLAAAMVLLFSHTWIVLYLLATGKVISRVVKERGIAEELLEQARRLRLRAIPWLLAALAAVAATFLTGGAALAASVPGWVHHTLFYLTLLLQGGAVVAERRVLAEHERLAAELGRRLRADAA